MAGKGDTAGVNDPTTPPSVFNPTAVTSTAVGADTTYDPFGLPSGMGTQRVYVGYTEPTQQYTAGRQVDAKGDMTGIAHTSGGVENSTVTVDDLIKHFHDLATSSNPYTRQTWAQVQQQLQAMNAYGTSTRINFGAWGDDDKNALAKAIQGYMQGGDTNVQTFEEYVSQTAAQGTANGLDGNQAGAPGGSGGSQRAPLQMANSADLNEALDNTSQQFLGRADDAQTGAFTGQEHAQEQQAYDAAGNANGAAYEGPASAQDAARQFILQNNLPEYAAHQAEGFMNVFANMFLTGASQRANTTLGDAAVGG